MLDFHRKLIVNSNPEEVNFKLCGKINATLSVAVEGKDKLDMRSAKLL